MSAYLEFDWIDISSVVDTLCEQLELGDKTNVQSILLESSKATAYVYVTDENGFKIVDGGPVTKRLTFRVTT